MLTLSNKEARHLILANQGLIENFFGSGKEATQQIIEHLGYVQIDTISVVARAHHHTLWARSGNYKKSHLDTLLEKDKTIFEYWSHAAAYLPMSDFRFSLFRKNLYAADKNKRFRNKKLTKYVYDRIVAEGALQSKDFEDKKRSSGWWEWKDSKRALEQLFLEGRLMIAGRASFQKVYDITERVLPKGINTQAPTDTEYAEYLFRKSIRANGIAAKDEISYLRRHAAKPVAIFLKERENEGQWMTVEIEGLKHETFYTTPASLDKAAAIKKKKHVKILSPFDNSVIQRKRLKQLFNFDYTIECYVPEPKRIYGYFCLPILYGDEFAGRIDCKAERSDKVLRVKNIFYEKKYARSEELKTELNKALNKFARFNGCKEVVAGR